MLQWDFKINIQSRAGRVSSVNISVIGSLPVCSGCGPIFDVFVKSSTRDNKGFMGNVVANGFHFTFLFDIRCYKLYSKDFKINIWSFFALFSLYFHFFFRDDES